MTRLGGEETTSPQLAVFFVSLLVRLFVYFVFQYLSFRSSPIYKIRGELADRQNPLQDFMSKAVADYTYSDRKLHSLHAALVYGLIKM